MQSTAIKHLALESNDHTITMDDLEDSFGGNYYCNARFHLGQMMSRMIKSGEFVRIKKGVYKLNFAPIVKTKNVNIDPNQSKLF